MNLKETDPLAVSGTVVDKPLDDLLLDHENPRFGEATEKLTQKEIAKILWDEMHLDELILSLGVNGYYRQEPLLVLRDKNKYVVVEGNRRLASIKIMLNTEYSKYVGARTAEFPKLTPARIKELSSLPVIVYEDRAKLWSYLSFRHINGPRNWSAISKAEFVAHLHLTSHLSFEDILRSIGDKNRTSIKLFNGLMVLRQGENSTRFSRDDFNASKFNFSHLYTIIQYPTTKKFLGIEKLEASSPFPKKPVPPAMLKRLEELLIWIFGSKSKQTEALVKSQNPDLRMLDDILANKDALITLRESSNLQDAYEYTEKEDKRLESYVSRAEKNIRKAKSMEDFYKGDEDLVRKIKTISEISNEMYEKMTSRHKGK